MSKLKSYCWCWFSMLALLLSGTTLRAITVPPVVQSLQAMSFSNGWDVVADPGSPGYLLPDDWSPTNSYPHLFKRADLVVMFVTVQVGPTNGYGQIELKGTEVLTSSLTFTGGVYTGVGPGLVTVVAVSTTGLPNTVYEYNPLRIKWQYRSKGVGMPDFGDWTDVGQTFNRVYVSFEAPGQSVPAPPLWHTVVDLACARTLANTKEQAFTTLWNKFTPVSLEDATGTPLYYQQPGIGWNNIASSASQLLQTKNGESAAWCELLALACRVNGIATVPYYVETQRTDYPYDMGFLFKNWTVAYNNPYPYEPGYPYFLRTANFAVPVDILNFEMVPAYSGTGNYGDLTSTTGIIASDRSTPAEKVACTHHVLKITAGGGIYYSPSYGVSFANSSSFESQLVFGLRKIITNVPDRFGFHGVTYVRAAAGGSNLKISLE